MRFKNSKEDPDRGTLFVFELSRSEMRWFMEILRQYPLLDSAYHRLSNSEKIGTAGQHWLETAMAEKRQENRAFLDEILPRKCPGQHSPDPVELCLTPDQANRLLQILNDVRVGSWNHLGKPNPESSGEISVTSADARYVTLMELSGYFEMSILDAFRSA